MVHHRKGWPTCFLQTWNLPRLSPGNNIWLQNWSGNMEVPVNAQINWVYLQYQLQCNRPCSIDTCSECDQNRIHYQPAAWRVDPSLDANWWLHWGSERQKHTAAWWGAPGPGCTGSSSQMVLNNWLSSNSWWPINIMYHILVWVIFEVQQFSRHHSR